VTWLCNTGVGSFLGTVCLCAALLCCFMHRNGKLDELAQSAVVISSSSQQPFKAGKEAPEAQALDTQPRRKKKKGKGTRGSTVNTAIGVLDYNEQNGAAIEEQ
jgi:hypothetical protein